MAKKAINICEFMTISDDVYIPKNSKLIGKTIDDITKEFDLINGIISYHLGKDHYSREDIKELKSDIKLEEGWILIHGQWGEIKKFEKIYDLK